MTSPRPIRPRKSAGFSLIEVTLALSVAAFCLLAILGLLQTGITSQRATVEQTAATSIASMIYSDLAGIAGIQKTPRYEIDLSSTGAVRQSLFFDDAGRPTGLTGVAATANSRYRASIEIQPPATATATTGVRILVTWPATADPIPANWPVKFSGSVETWTALGRN